ncbi:MAG: stage III sporulation protein AD [Butyrivibrio sp.]|nr:stage III sporulation protein AD [Acetatifactor muris]MCM1560633.1 stage III sporulation protein AD [Butyrivibrio sp.]
MQELVKVVFLGIAGVMLAIQFKSRKPEYGMYMGLAVGILVFGYALRQVAAVTAQLGKLQSYLGGAESYLAILLKVIGITYICEFGADICKDAGYQTVAGQIEVLGKLSVMFAGLPVLFAVIEQIQSFL